ncbi:MAG: hypothetical protein PHP54_04390 [Clostridia bacterium]|nr:hypothetical protein [Clostridia bacterium]
MSTVATVTIMLILMTTIIIAANNISTNTKRINFASEIKTIQQAVNSYASKNDGDYPVLNNIVVDISALDTAYQNQFKENLETVMNGKIVLNEIDYDKIGITDLKYGNGKRSANDIYAVSMQTGKVYYVMGLTINNYSYYTLTTDLVNLLKLSDKQIDITDPVIVFTPNNIDWSNTNVEVSIKIPKLFSLQEIKVNNTAISIANPIEEGSYNVYNVENTGNYSILVTYTNSQISTQKLYAKYSVTNFDNIAPAFTLGEVKKMDGGNLSGYVDITSKIENGSGLKKIKYEYNGIYETAIGSEDKKTVKAHFENNGIELDTKATMIPIRKETRKLTVYMEDNAGNNSIMTIGIDLKSEFASYIQNGLILHLDGIQNTRAGHNSSSKIWEDLSAQGNNGTLKFTSPTWNENSLAFSSSNANAVLFGIMNPTYVTQELVFKFDSLATSDVQTIFANFEGGGYGYEYNKLTNKFYYQVFVKESGSYKQVVIDANPQVGKIYYLSSKYDGNNITIYSNGEKIGSLKVPGTIGIPSNTIMAMGANPTGNGIDTYYCDITVYSARIYNRVCSDAEIMSNYLIDRGRF